MNHKIGRHLVAGRRDLTRGSRVVTKRRSLREEDPHPILSQTLLCGHGNLDSCHHNLYSCRLTHAPITIVFFTSVQSQVIMSEPSKTMSQNKSYPFSAQERLWCNLLWSSFIRPQPPPPHHPSSTPTQEQRHV